MSAMISGRLRQRWQNLVEYRTFGRADIKDSYHWDFLWAFFRSFLCMFWLFLIGSFICIAGMNNRNVQLNHWPVSMTGWNDLFMNGAFKAKIFAVEDSWNVFSLKRLIGLKIQDFDSANVSWMIVWEIEQLRAVDFFQSVRLNQAKRWNRFVLFQRQNFWRPQNKHSIWSRKRNPCSVWQFLLSNRLIRCLQQRFHQNNLRLTVNMFQAF